MANPDPNDAFEPHRRTHGSVHTASRRALLPTNRSFPAMNVLFQPLSLRAKVALVSMLALGISTLLTCVMALASYYQEAEVRLLSGARQRAQITARDVSIALLSGTQATAQRSIDALRVAPDVLYAVLLDPE